VVLQGQVVGMGDSRLGSMAPAAAMPMMQQQPHPHPAQPVMPNNPYGGYQPPQQQQPAYPNPASPQQYAQPQYPQAPAYQPQYQQPAYQPPAPQAYNPPQGAYGMPAPAPAQAHFPAPGPGAGSPSGSSSSAPYNPYGAANNQRPVAQTGDLGNIVPIQAINPYSSKWTIKARVTSKSEIRKWSNARGEGHLFSIDLLDSAGGEIRGTFFKEACDKWFANIAEQSVYTFSGGKLKVVTNKQFTSIKNNYELTFDSNSDIRPSLDEDGIKTIQYNFVKIADIANVEVNQLIDVMTIIKDVNDPTEIVSQKMGGRTIRKRDLVVFDDSNTEIRLTLWSEKCDMADLLPGNVMCIKGCKVGDYQGKSLSTSNR
jgi:replication factor A1